MNVIRYIDLFCGLGAFHVAFDRFNVSQSIDNVAPLSAVPIPPLTRLSANRGRYGSNNCLTFGYPTAPKGALPDFVGALSELNTGCNRNSGSSTAINTRKYYKCVMACDIDESIRSIYEENFKIKPKGDIRGLCMSEIPDFDILCAGFPCQPFSIAGKKESFNNKTDGNLFYDILKIIDNKRPSVLFLENVKNLYSIEGGKIFKIIKFELEKRGYKVSYKIINSKYYGSPQSRERIYIVCFLSETTPIAPNSAVLPELSQPNGRESLREIALSHPSAFNRIIGKEYTFRDVRKQIVPVSSIMDYNELDSAQPIEHLDYKEKYHIEPCYIPKKILPAKAALEGCSASKAGYYPAGNRLPTAEQPLEGLNQSKIDTATARADIGPIMKYKLINKKTGKGGRQGERVYSIDSCGPTICASSGGLGAKTGLYEIPKEVIMVEDTASKASLKGLNQSKIGALEASLSTHHPNIRRLTISESLQMFGFNKDYKYQTLRNKKKMLHFLGNSIVINVLEELIKDL